MALGLIVATFVGPSLASGATPHALPKLDILVVAGQSNALGYQSFVVDPTTHKDVFTDASRSPADKKVLIMWDESGVPTSGSTPVPLDTPQKLKGSPSPVFGPELGLARQLYAAGHHDLLVVKVAFSGSSLAVDWQPKAADFQALVLLVEQAESWAQSNGWSPSIAGVYWMQGESDAMASTWASSYKANLKKFMANVRSQLGLSTKTPFVLGETDIDDFIYYEQTHDLCGGTSSCSPEKRWNDEVTAAQSTSAARYVFVTSTKSLPLRALPPPHEQGRAHARQGIRIAERAAPHLAATNGRSGRLRHLVEGPDDPREAPCEPERTRGVDRTGRSEADGIGLRAEVESVGGPHGDRRASAAALEAHLDREARQ